MHMLVYYDTCMVYIYMCMCKCMYVCTCIHTNTCVWICIYVQLFLLYLTQYTAIFVLDIFNPDINVCQLSILIQL